MVPGAIFIKKKKPPLNVQDMSQPRATYLQSSNCFWYTSFGWYRFSITVYSLFHLHYYISSVSIFKVHFISCRFAWFLSLCNVLLSWIFFAVWYVHNPNVRFEFALMFGLCSISSSRGFLMKENDPQFPF